MSEHRDSEDRRSFLRRSSLGLGSAWMAHSILPGGGSARGAQDDGGAKVAEPAREVPVLVQADVVVCGGGPSGIMAAVAAARNGAKTLLVEKYGFLGGMATAGLVGPMSKFKLGGKWIVGGIPFEFIHELAKHGGALLDLPSGNVPFDPEVYKGRALEMALGAGVELLFHSRVVSCVESEAGTISHAILETPSGRQAVGGRAFVDCTGSGDLVARSSLPWKMRSEPGTLQPMSLQFRLGGVDTDNLTVLMAHDGVKYRNVDLSKILAEEVAQERLANFGGPWTVWGSTIRPGEVSVNGTRFGGNATDVREITQAEIQMRRDITRLVEAFRKYAPQFKDCYLLDSATQVGVRETRAIVGEYELRPQDVLQPQDFPDTVAQGGHPVDIHLPGSSGQEVQFVRKAYNIPYRCLAPKGAANLLVGGGSISASKQAFATTRVQAQCMALGEAAGTAAALCCSRSLPAGGVDARSLRRALQANGRLPLGG